MYPTLFYIGSFRVDTYSVVWFIALSIAIIWAIKRLEIYELDEYEARRIMAISFLFMLIGARSYEYIAHWKIYVEHPSYLLDLNRGGLHEFGAVAGAFLSALILCAFNKKISFAKLCDTAAPPAMLAIAIGRWGCFLNGCCVGLPTKFLTGVHFPRDHANLFRHPVQIYYSVIASVIVIILLYVEKKILPIQRKNGGNYYSVIAPLTLILYGLMRFAVVSFRDYTPLLKMIKYAWTYRGITLALPFALMWLIYSVFKLRKSVSM